MGLDSRMRKYEIQFQACALDHKRKTRIRTKRGKMEQIATNAMGGADPG